MIYCCAFHMDQAIDDFVERFQEPPDIDLCEEQRCATYSCAYCTDPAGFVLQRVRQVEDSQGSE